MDHLISKNRQFIVLAGEKMEWLAEDLSHKYPKWFIQGKIDWNCFPDGTPNIFIHNMDKIKNRHILFLASHHDYKAKYMQLAAIYVLARSMVRTLTISLPFFDTATMERISKEGEIATADFDAWLFSSLPFPVEIIIYDLHTLQNRLYFHGGATITMATGINLLKKEIYNLKSLNIKIAFPDDGAQKRFGLAFKDYEQIVCKKVRDGNNRYVDIASGSPINSHVIIVDDLVQSGGTLLECKNLLMLKGASKVSAYVTHAIFPNRSWRKFMDAGFEHFFVTNTFHVSSELIGQKPFKILSIADDIVTHLLADINN